MEEIEKRIEEVVKQIIWKETHNFTNKEIVTKATSEVKALIGQARQEGFEDGMELKRLDAMHKAMAITAEEIKELEELEKKYNL